MSGMKENKMSLKNSDNTKGGSGSVRKEEGFVGSKGGEGVRFKMPAESEICDHSKTRSTLKE
jgi:hypothetical protein